MKESEARKVSWAMQEMVIWHGLGLLLLVFVDIAWSPDPPLYYAIGVVFHEIVCYRIVRRYYVRKP